MDKKKSSKSGVWKSLMLLSLLWVLVILCDKLKPVITASLSLVVLAIQDGDRFTFGTIVGA